MNTLVVGESRPGEGGKEEWIDWVAKEVEECCGVGWGRWGCTRACEIEGIGHAF